jgi:uncharacterized protein with HEPN domain
MSVCRTSRRRSTGSGVMFSMTGRDSIPTSCCKAVLHWIEIIGEAARGVSDKVGGAYPEVRWRVITDMRNRVTHGYFDIDLDIVWNTVTSDLPKLSESVTQIRTELDSEAEGSREE